MSDRVALEVQAVFGKTRQGLISTLCQPSVIFHAEGRVSAQELSLPSPAFCV